MADFLSKPLQGKLFSKFRALILNDPYDSPFHTTNGTDRANGDRLNSKLENVFTAARKQQNDTENSIQMRKGTGNTKRKAQKAKTIKTCARASDMAEARELVGATAMSFPVGECLDLMMASFRVALDSWPLE